MIRTRRLIAPVFWMLVLWILSSIPTAPDHTTGGVFIPKLVQKTMHGVLYAVLAATWLWDFGPRRVDVKMALSAVCLASAYAAVDEYHQTFVPGRTGCLIDVGLDTLGAVFGVCVVAAWRRQIAAAHAAAAPHG